MHKNTTARGYGHVHQVLRRRWAPSVERGEVRCARCGNWIAPGTPWDLGHDDHDRSHYTGPEHQFCNRRTAAHRKARRGIRRAQSRDWFGDRGRQA